MNINRISDQIADAANDAIRDALESALVSSYDIDTDDIESIIEEAVEDRLEEAVEAALKERKPEPVFTVAELSAMRSGLHSQRMQAISEEHAKRSAAIRFKIDMETDEWKRFESEDTDRLDALYEKLSDMISQAIANK